MDSWRCYKNQSCAVRQRSTNITADQLVLLSSLLSSNNLNKMIIFSSSVATCTLMSSSVGPMVGEEVLGAGGLLVCFFLRFPQTTLRALTSAGK